VSAIYDAEAAHMQQWAMSPWVLHLIRDNDAWLNLTIEASEAASELGHRTPHEDLFWSFGFLTHRWVSHHRAIFALLSTGRYGEVAALSRMLFEVTDTLGFLSICPDEAPAWRKYTGAARSTDKKAAARFSQHRIREEVAKANLPVLSKESRESLNAAVHAGVHGARAYGLSPVGHPEVVGLFFTPQFDQVRAFQFGLFANETLPGPVDSFVRICEKVRAQKSVWRPIRGGYDSLFPTWQGTRWIGERFQQLHAEIERRVQNGEEIGVVIDDIQVRFRTAEKQGKRPTAQTAR
jgi:hypothetical protein